MGICLNPGLELFEECLRDEIYEDKTGILELFNRRIGGAGKKYLCVSRVRRSRLHSVPERGGGREADRHRVQVGPVRRFRPQADPRPLLSRLLQGVLLLPLMRRFAALIGSCNDLI